MVYGRYLIVAVFLLITGISGSGQSKELDSLLTKEEKMWLEANRDFIRYAPNPSWAPGDYVDEDGRHQGIISDYIEIFEEKLDVKFQKVYYASWNEMYSALIYGDIDFLGAIQKTEEREKVLLFTEPVLNIPIVVLVNNDRSVDFSGRDLDNISISAVTGYITQNYLSENYTNYELIEYDDDLTALIQASMGNVDGTIIDLMTASYLVEKYGITNLNIGATLDFIWHLGFAFSHDQQTLSGIISKVLSTISEDQRREIFNKWVNIDSIQKQNFFQRNYKILLVSIIFFLLAILIFIIYAIILRRQVRKRTRQLDEELKAKNVAIEMALKNEARLESLFELSNVKTDKSSVFLDFALQEIVRLTESKFGLLYKYLETTDSFELSNETLYADFEKYVSRVNPVFSSSELLSCYQGIKEKPELLLNICNKCKLRTEGSCPITASRFRNVLVYPITDEKGLEALLFLGSDISYDRGDTQQVILLINAVWKLLSKQKWQEELVIARARAEESDRLKSAFLANLSHEIRTPMNGIIGFADLLKEPDLTEKQRSEYLSIIHKSTHYLLSVITDIIEISKIESGSVKPNMSVFDVDNLVEEIRQDALHMLNGNKDVSLLVRREEVADRLISTDEIKLKQVIQNLLSNAVKYTEKGFIRIAYRVVPNNLVILVEDTGPGIEEQYYNVIFKRFRQGDRELAIKKGGTGLGLSIAESYVNMLGGSITISSEPGKGTVFTVSVPIRMVNKKQADIPEDEIKKGKTVKALKILIAEDNQANFFYLEELLLGQMHTIIHAWNGTEALELLASNPDTDIILLDIKMPEMDGYQVITAIRKAGNPIPVIAQTAYALSEDLERIHSSGFDGYISKPIVKKDLFEIIARFA